MFVARLIVVVIVLFLTGCQSLTDRIQFATTPAAKEPQSTQGIVEAAAPTADTAEVPSSSTSKPVVPPPSPAAASSKQLRRIVEEPVLAVFLQAGPKVQLTLTKTSTIITATDTNIRIEDGDLVVTATPQGLITNATGSQLLGNKISIRPETCPKCAGIRLDDYDVRTSPADTTFAAVVHPPFGESQTLTFSGHPLMTLDPLTGQVLLMEKVGLERYLQGVLPTEISPAWPLEAIKAQATVARSYTLDRYLTRLEQPWQLHWHFAVDMAYGGFQDLNKRMALALQQTRGQVLTVNSLPVPALFHASSGGRTESVANFRPNLKAADGATTLESVMPSIVDPYAISGAKSLGFASSHINWLVQLPLRKISTGLQKWAVKHPQDLPPIGTVLAVRMAERFADSDRVAQVVVRHRLHGKEVETPLNAATFRLAVGPKDIRSTNWQSCKVTSGKEKALHIAGRGFGHGVGLSQISAYQMAKVGKSAGEIIRHFYPGAKLAKWW